MTEVILEARDLTKHFPIAGSSDGRPNYVRALDGVSLQVSKGETLSIVGESGCGKSTVGRAILGLMPLTSGSVTFQGVRLDRLPLKKMRDYRRHLQIVFQDPFSSLNPRMRVGDIIAEPIRNFALARSKEELDRKVAELIERVRLPVDAAKRWPHEFSGGQRQRICIARALATGPELIVCDEAVSALDVSIKAQIVNLLGDLQRELNLALIFISHDLGIVEHISDRVAVMYLGRVTETGTKAEVFTGPKHPYTQALLSAVPVAEPGAKSSRIILQGDVPSPAERIVGCRFQSRCPLVFDRCRHEEPELSQLSPSHGVACHLAQS